jgi:hypothetical protein
MMRLISAIALGLALAVAAPVASDAVAKKSAKSVMCKAAGLDGKRVSWSCKSGQTCCWNAILGQGTCGAKGAACM